MLDQKSKVERTTGTRARKGLEMGTANAQGDETKLGTDL